jgi:pseudaminic acid synthase
MRVAMKLVRINGRQIGSTCPPYIIAEMSANHNGSLERAKAIITAAHEAGADAVKLQTYRADTITLDHDGPEFLVHGGLWDGSRLYDLYKKAAMPWEWHKPLFEHAKALGICIFSSAFDGSAVDLLEECGTPAYKIASLEVCDLPLIQRVAATGKPVIISTGASEIGEISEAVDAARNAGCEQLILLHCTSGYPTPATESNLRTISHLSEMFDVVVGLSDHTMGVAVPIAGVALGAAVIEKHFTLRRADGGVDSTFSLEPEELAIMVEGARTAWNAIGQVSYRISSSEKNVRGLRRSLYVVADVAADELISERHVRSIRPGLGLPPKYLSEVIGKRASRNLKRGSPLSWDMLS